MKYGHGYESDRDNVKKVLNSCLDKMEDINNKSWFDEDCPNVCRKRKTAKFKISSSHIKKEADCGLKVVTSQTIMYLK